MTERENPGMMTGAELEEIKKACSPETIKAAEIYGYRWALQSLSNTARVSVPRLLAEVDALTAALEAEKKRAETWIPTSKRLPSEGETVEIMRISDRITAIYEPNENRYLPWKLIDYMPTGIWHRSAEAVTHWRPCADNTKGGQEDEG